MSLAATSCFFLLALCVFALAEQDARSFDVTTIYNLAGTSGETRNISGRVSARTNARGLPLRRGDAVISGANGGLWTGDWRRDGWRKLTASELEELVTPPVLDPVFKTLPPSPDLQPQPDGSWGGPLQPGDLVRINFTPRHDGRGFLSFVMCDSPRLGRCEGAVISGHQDGRLRHLWSRYGILEKRGPHWAPGAGDSSLKMNVLDREESVLEVWKPVKQYTILLEFTPERKLRIILEGGDVEQEKKRVFDVPINYNYFSVGSYKDGEVNAQVDTVWRGRVSGRSEYKLTWMPTNSTNSHLGVAICQNATQETCYSLLMSGATGGKLRFFWSLYGPEEKYGPFWVPGRGPHPLMNTPIYLDKTSRKQVLATWEPRVYNFRLIVRPQRVELVMEGGDPAQANELKWNVPQGFNFVAIGPYRNEGRLKVQAPKPPARPAWPVWTLEYGRVEGVMEGPSFPYPANLRLCVLMSAKVPLSGTLRVGYRLPDFKEVRPLVEINGTENSVWKTVREVVNVPRSRVSRINFVVSARTSETSPDRGNIHIQMIDTCEEEGDEDLYAIFSENLPRNEVFGYDVAGSGAAQVATTTISRNPCRHGGVFDETAVLCRCPPGFTGAICDIGCGANRYGADCKARCSSGNAGCSGLLLCGPGVPCSCAPGYTGPTCERECPEFKYGPDCSMKCGNCYQGDSCDTFTGHCRRGCSEGFQAPLCLERCGNVRVTSGLSVGGYESEVTDFPWVTALYYQGDKKFVCGGSLVRPNVVVTAMHCLWDRQRAAPRKPEEFVVALGKTKSSWFEKEENDFRSNVSVIFGFEQNGGYADRLGAYRDDIAVLLLSKAVPRDSPNAAPVCLDFADPETLDRKIGSVAGWGELSLGAGVEATRLYTADLPFISKKDCRRLVSAKSQGDLTLIGEDKLCAGVTRGLAPTGAVLSKGDSGSGYCFKDSRGTWYLRGVVSAGLGSTHDIMTFSDVNYYQDFVKENCDRGDFAEAIAGQFD